MGEGLHVFVNRRRFDGAHGILPRMTGESLAALLGVPADNAVVEIATEAGDWREIGMSDIVDLQTGMQVLVTRQFVMGGRGDREAAR
ncbi:hypothetical protein [Salinarimonas soli]|uniref:Multi-ubiquitin domain-containing protein n=1 Tax=Salinarimonas soli TaxID=1638099 RepID=A0A5B2VY04_9HYPH|nr:hypothetical protein [Salinarimonas soli]KAA2244261.1 hypothetical protein F0L46_01035 [Salinarimonas soli]